MVLLAYVQVVREVNMKKAAKGLSVTIQNLRKAAEQGDAEAQFSLGSCYDEGEGVRVDKSLAVKWCRKAAEQGLAVAKEGLRLMCKPA